MIKKISLAIILALSHIAICNAGQQIHTQDIAPGTTFYGFFNGDGSALTNISGSAACSPGAGAGSVVCQGVGNSAAGVRAFAGGGSNNVADGDYSHAVGQSAKSDLQGCFVWNDAGIGVQPKDCRGVPLSYNIYARNGAYFDTSITTFTGNVYVAGKLNVVGANSSTYTYILGEAASRTVLGQCMVGSTVTLSVANTALEVDLIADAFSGTTQEYAVSFLVNGAFVEGMSTTRAPVVQSNPSQSSCKSVRFTFRVPPQGAGNVSMCLTAASSGGSPLIITGSTQNCAYIGAFTSRSVFGFKEVH